MGLKLHCSAPDCRYETEEVPEFECAMRLLTLHMTHIHPTSVVIPQPTLISSAEDQITAESADNKTTNDIENILTGAASPDMTAEKNNPSNRVAHSTLRGHHQREELEDPYLEHDKRHLQAATSPNKRNPVWVQRSEYGVYDVAGITNQKYDLGSRAVERNCEIKSPSAVGGIVTTSAATAIASRLTYEPGSQGSSTETITKLEVEKDRSNCDHIMVLVIPACIVLLIFFITFIGLLVI